MSLDASYNNKYEYILFRGISAVYKLNGGGRWGVKTFWWRGEFSADDNTVRIGLLEHSS